VGGLASLFLTKLVTGRLKIISSVISVAKNSWALKVKGLSKSHNGTVAVAGVELEVEYGEVFGIVGRKSTGKTTLIETIEGLQVPDQGEISILGLDLFSNSHLLRERIGVQLQKPSFCGNLKVIELLRQFRRYYVKKADTEALLEDTGLSEKRDVYIKHLLGGQLQRLALALALINDPEIVFLDEPTSGLNSSAAIQVWQIIDKIKSEGKTVILTTKSGQEAERLCDRVCILNAGRINEYSMAGDNRLLESND